MLFNSAWFENLSNNHSSTNQASWEAKYRFILQLIWVTARKYLEGSSRKPEYYTEKKTKNISSKQRCSRCNEEEPTSSKSIIHTCCKELSHEKTLKENKQEFVGTPQQQNNSTWVTKKQSSQRLLSSNDISLGSQPWQVQPSPISAHFSHPREVGLCTITVQVFLTSDSFLHNRKCSCGTLRTVLPRGIWTPQNNRLKETLKQPVLFPLVSTSQITLLIIHQAIPPMHVHVWGKMSPFCERSAGSRDSTSPCPDQDLQHQLVLGLCQPQT